MRAAHDGRDILAVHMDNDNYLDLDAPARDAPARDAPARDAPARDAFIYRIVPIERLFELFANRQNVLVKTKKWDDPFENFILRSRLTLPTGEQATIGFRDQFYGQCWTFHKASDAMWRIYSPKADAVRIRSTIRKLAESLSSRCGDWAPHEAFIGKVRYLPYRELITFAKGAFSGDSGFLMMRTFARTLFVKRLAFGHEREVRLLFIPHEHASAVSDLFAYSVDPHVFIDQIMIDPRLGLQEVDALKQRIRARTEFEGEIKRSLMYASPPEFAIPLRV